MSFSENLIEYVAHGRYSGTIRLVATGYASFSMGKVVVTILPSSPPKYLWSNTTKIISYSYYTCLMAWQQVLNQQDAAQ